MQQIEDASEQISTATEQQSVVAQEISKKTFRLFVILRNAI
ncbi:hypothetical protein QW180_18055 [Vibrio sinaloensis]|nr:hypothetical protein [Vibrio sinaloensis]